DDEEHDRRQQPHVPLEQAGVGDLRFPLGALAQLALEPSLPALPAPVGIGRAQALGPGADHLLLLAGAAGDGLLGPPQRCLELLLPFWVRRLSQAGHLRRQSRIPNTTSSPPQRIIHGISSAATRARSSSERTLSTRWQLRA